ncbi:MFS transporter [Pseudoalteromonas byunsanensis]|uniref:Major facilitator superfamily (MFS) profile domain-containing protein n=1 Tax=Pseudoalteromonas byunsanensis TaxID=327939 RepID=A0A1S1N7E5_9GAMM|nr:MFS transporter [Pseudoalteromonas byunsanensis]OHU95394.1 hypothetical protein BIW53_11835 [Pseudoalteromonas byunsanensis]
MEIKQTATQAELLDAQPMNEPVDELKQCPDFLRIWKGQAISVFGSQMVAFAFSIWVYQQTQSLLQFGGIIVAQLLPTLFLAPVAGVLCDRFSRRNIMMGCQFALTLASAVLCVLAFRNELNVTAIMMMSPIISSFGSVHQIAYTASISQLVPKNLYAKANGYVQSSIHFSAVIIPLIAVGLLETIGIALIILASIATYLLSTMTLVFSTLPYRGESTQAATQEKAAIFNLRSEVLGVLFKDKNVLILITFLSLISFLNGVVMVLFRPMILTTMSSIALGWIVTLAGFAGLMGALMAGKLAARNNRIQVLFIATVTSGITMVLCGALTNAWGIALLVFIYSLFAPIGTVVAQTILQTITAPEIQGRVFAARAFFATVAMLFAVTLAPVGAELFLEPSMMPGGMLANLLGDVIGTGPGRGMGLVFVLCGLTMFSIIAILSVMGAFRRLQSQMSQHFENK